MTYSSSFVEIRDRMFRGLKKYESIFFTPTIFLKDKTFFADFELSQQMVKLTF